MNEFNKGFMFALGISLFCVAITFLFLMFVFWNDKECKENLKPYEILKDMDNKGCTGIRPDMVFKIPCECD